MSTFYVLPPRPWLRERLESMLQIFFPGLNWNAEQLADLAAVFAEQVEDGGRAPGGSRDHSNVYVVHREDLPAGEALDRALADGFGAEPGDEVVEVRPGSRPGETTARRWTILPEVRDQRSEVRGQKAALTSDL